MKIIGQLVPKGQPMPDVSGDFKFQVRIKGEEIFARLPDQSPTEG